MGKAAVGDDIAFRAGDADIVCTPVSVGNPHAVIFADDVEEIPLTVLGPQIEHHENFPGGVNVEFVQVLSEKELRMRVWERGSGVTWHAGPERAPVRQRLQRGGTVNMILRCRFTWTEEH